jgi:hypothetical protein
MRNKKSTIIAWALMISICCGYWVWADLTSHTEALLDTLILSIDPNADGSTADATIPVAALEIGHASDTTLSRAAAGQLAVEGDNLIRESDSLGVFNLSDGGTKEISRISFIAGENITTSVPCSLRYDSGDSRTEIYKYVGDTTDTNNDTYPIVGVNMAACTTGNACTIFIGSCLLARRDETTPASTDIGAALYTLGIAGGIGTIPQSTSGDHNEMVGVYAAANGYDSVTGDYILYRVPTYMNVVP